MKKIKERKEALTKREEKLKCNIPMSTLTKQQRLTKL